MRRRDAVALGVRSLFGAAGLSAACSAFSQDAAVSQPAFDGVKALSLLQKQCDFGPRFLGSPGHAKAKDFLFGELKKYADTALVQEFSYRDMPVSNLIGIFHPRGEKKPASQPIILLAHWDTRPVADGPLSAELDKGPFRWGRDGWNRMAPILGANDGASGVAVLLELAHLFHERPPNAGVVILLVDGEDYGDFRVGPNGQGVLLGSTHFADNFRNLKPVGLPRWGVLLDMVGAKNLLLPTEEISRRNAPELNAKIFRIAKELGHGNVFRANAMQEVEDDHVPLIGAGIPTVDLIHPLPYGGYERTGYAHWHTLDDTPDKCSASSLAAVGETVAELVYREKVDA